MTDSYEKLIADTIAATKAEMKKNDAEKQVRIAEAFNKASGLIHALEELKMIPGSRFDFSVDMTTPQIQITTNIRAFSEASRKECVTLGVDQQGTIRTWYLQLVINGEPCGVASNKENVEAIVKRVTRAAVEKGLV